MSNAITIIRAAVDHQRAAGAREDATLLAGMQRTLDAATERMQALLARNGELERDNAALVAEAARSTRAHTAKEAASQRQLQALVQDKIDGIIDRLDDQIDAVDKKFSSYRRKWVGHNFPSPEVFSAMQTAIAPHIDALRAHRCGADLSAVKRELAPKFTEILGIVKAALRNIPWSRLMTVNERVYRGPGYSEGTADILIEETKSRLSAKTENMKALMRALIATLTPLATPT